MMAGSTTSSNQRPDTLTQDSCQLEKTSCDARPDHTFGSITWFCGCVSGFRSTPMSRHPRGPAACLKRADAAGKLFRRLGGASLIRARPNVQQRFARIAELIRIFRRPAVAPSFFNSIGQERNTRSLLATQARSLGQGGAGAHGRDALSGPTVKMTRKEASHDI